MALSHFSPPPSLSVSRLASVSWLSGFSSHSDRGISSHLLHVAQFRKRQTLPRSQAAGSHSVCHPLVSQLAVAQKRAGKRKWFQHRSGSGSGSGGSEPLVKCVQWPMANGQHTVASIAVTSAESSCSRRWRLAAESRKAEKQKTPLQFPCLIFSASFSATTYLRSAATAMDEKPYNLDL